MTTLPDPSLTPPPAPARWLKIALLLSLAVNLAVLGAIGGAALHGASERHGPKVRDIAFGPFTDALSLEDREALGAAFAREGGNPRAMRREMRAEFVAFLAVLRSVPLDEAALRQSFAALQAKGRERLELGQRLLSDRIVAMTPEARARFADRLEAIIERGPARLRPDTPGG